MLRIGTAGWTIRRQYAAVFAGPGPHLTRYAGRLNAVEINSSFYRPHKSATYARWSRETPDDFSFSVKMIRTVTHEARLKDTAPMLERFFAECAGLGNKLGCVLVQLPPSLMLDIPVADAFFIALRRVYRGAVAFEPRHVSWFTQTAADLLAEHDIARVLADPPPAKLDDAPAGATGLRYWRLHGSPRMYYSDYGADFLDALARRLAESRTGDSWCIFDNTALGHATANALALGERMAQ